METACLMNWWTWSCFLMGGNQCWTQPSCFLSRKRNSQTIVKTRPSTCNWNYLHNPLHLPIHTWPLEKCPVWSFSLQALVVHQVTENFLPEGPVTIGITSGAWLGSEGSGVSSPVAVCLGGVLGGWKKDSNKLQRMIENLRNKFGGMRKRWQL